MREHEAWLVLSTKLWLYCSNWRTMGTDNITLQSNWQQSRVTFLKIPFWHHPPILHQLMDQHISWSISWCKITENIDKLYLHWTICITCDCAVSITSGNHWLNLNIKARAFNHQTITCIYCSATANHTFTTFQFPWILEEKDLDWLCLGGKRPWLNCPLPNSGILWWPCSLSSRTITLRQGKHSFSWFSEVTCTAQAVVTKLLNSHVWIKPYLVASHITSPQIMLLLLLLISSKPVASNNTSQCFGVVCQGLVLQWDC